VADNFYWEGFFPMAELAKTNTDAQLQIERNFVLIFVNSFDGAYIGRLQLYRPGNNPSFISAIYE
jgi:hypothetical protein